MHFFLFFFLFYLLSIRNRLQVVDRGNNIEPKSKKSSIIQPVVSTVLLRMTRQTAKYTWNYDLSSPRDVFLSSIRPEESEKESPLVLFENYSTRERVRRVSCTSIQRTPYPPGTHTSVVAILTHPHLSHCYIGLAHTRPGSLAAGSVGEERIPCSPPFIPRTPGTTGRRPMESRVRGGAFGVGQHGSSSSCSPAGGHSAEKDPLRTSLVDTPVSTYCSSHVSLSRSLEPRLLLPAGRQKFHDAVTHVIRTG